MENLDTTLNILGKDWFKTVLPNETSLITITHQKKLSKRTESTIKKIFSYQDAWNSKGTTRQFKRR